MNAQERQMVDDLFQRLASLENSPRDRDAEAAIADGVRRAPHALYALVQTVLVQDEALKQADARIQELENAGAPRSSGGFLDSMRDALMGGGQRGSVPSVGGGREKWNSGQVMQQGAPQNGPYAGNGYGNGPQASPVSGGGSFLGTAAAAAAGMVGGSLLLNGIRGMMGGGQQTFGDTGGSRSPWGGNDQSNNSLAQEAGVNDIGHRGSVEDRRPLNDRNDYFADDRNQTNNEHASLDDDDEDDGEFDSDFDGGGDSDYA